MTRRVSSGLARVMNSVIVTPGELADRRSPQPAAFRDRPHVGELQDHGHGVDLGAALLDVADPGDRSVEPLGEAVLGQPELESVELDAPADRQRAGRLWHVGPPTPR